MIGVNVIGDELNSMMYISCVFLCGMFLCLLCDAFVHSFSVFNFVYMYDVYDICYVW